MSLEPTVRVLKRKVGYGQINEKNEEEHVWRDKRNKMDVDTGTTASGVVPVWQLSSAGSASGS